MKRLLSGFLFASLLAGQTALPVAHEWRVASGEAGHHVGLPSGPRWSGPEDASEGHEHHDAASCRVCPTISQTKARAGHASAALASASAEPRLPGGPARLLLGLLEAALHAPRGPPAA